MSAVNHVVLYVIAHVFGRYNQAQAQLDKVLGKAGSVEHMSAFQKDQNETLAKTLSALHRRVRCFWRESL